MQLKTGARLGPYEIHSPLGAGGMGEVYRGRDSRLGRDVAIKVLPKHLAGDSEALGRFTREAQTLAALSHPSILTLFDYGTEGEVIYAVMELLEGETLRARLSRSAPLPPVQVLQIGIAVSEGLAAAHSRGIIHRDLKPENIFLTSDGRVKILDFGLVRWTRSRKADDAELLTGPLDTKTGMLMGTVHYMSPEQVRGNTVDERTDIFSLGTVLYEMIHGVRPFAEETAAETMVAILKKEPEGSTASAPPDLDRLVRACLSKDPDRRTGSALDLAAALKQISGGSALSHVIQPVIPGSRTKRRKKTIDSIAILPITNTGSDPETEYMSDGITETLINLLSQIPKLRVMARSTVFAYKGKDVDPRSVGRELGVGAVLTGRLNMRNDSLNLLVELVDARDGAQLWSEDYSQQVCDIQSVQQKIAGEIYDRFRIRLAATARNKLQRRYTDSVHAYRLYLQGRFHWNERTEPGLLKGIEFFQQAIEEDAGFALAYAGLSDSYSVLGGFYFMPPSEAYPKARDAALKALNMDPTLAEAYCSLATVKERYDWDWEGAGKDFRRALRLNPGYATAHQWYATYLVMMGRPDEAEKEIEKALELDPLSPLLHWTRGYILYYARQYEKAVEQYRVTLEMAPDFMRARFDMALAYIMMGRMDHALREFETWLPQASPSPGTLPLLGYFYAVSGRPDMARDTIRRIEELPGEKYISRFKLSVIHVALHDYETAFDCLKKATENHEDALVSLIVNPRLDPLRKDPRYDDLLRAVGLAT